MTDSMTVARAVVRVLIDGGVRDVVVCPGSRSAPLAYALAEVASDPGARNTPPGRVRLHVRIDERSAGFTALGLALGSGFPTAVVTTSGTAVGNLTPAVMEANHSAVPLLVLSADRPAELRGTGANQTTRQAGLFGDHTRLALDVPADDVEGATAAAGRALTAAHGLRAPDDAAFSFAAEAPAGPVQLNLAFRAPLVPGDDDLPVSATPPAPSSGSAGTAAYRSTLTITMDASTGGDSYTGGDSVTGRAGRSALGTDGSIDGLVTEVVPSGVPQERRTVVVAGDGAGPEAAIFAAEQRLPLLAEPSSNARRGATAVAAYRLLIESLSPEVDRVVLFGRPTLSRPVAALLADERIETALWAPTPVAWFDPGRRRERIIADRDDLAAFAGAGPDGWVDRWTGPGAALRSALTVIAERAARAAGTLNGPLVAARVWAATDGILVVGSSNPVRDLDLTAGVGDAGPARVVANRGVAGIDGTISTATGVAIGAGGPVRALLGDVTYLHDATGWYLGAGEREPDLQVVVLNDAGGAIFALLEHGHVARRSAYTAAVERLFGTPHDVDLGAIAGAYGVRHERVHDVDALDAALAAPIRGRSLIEVVADRRQLAQLHARFTAEARSLFPQG